MQPDGVVLDADAGELGAQLAGAADVVQVRPLGLEVAEEVDFDEAKFASVAAVSFRMGTCAR